MKEELIENIHELLLRYIYIAFFIFLFAANYTSVTYRELTLLLLYIINNQMRYFIFPRKNIYMISSLGAEFLLCYILYEFPSKFGIFIFMPCLMDIINLYRKEYSIAFIFLVSGLMLQKGEIDLLMLWLLNSLSILILLITINKAEFRKVSAQELYDKLREKDDELKIANKELEDYANTIEEIAILRERNRISREIHDNVGHSLATIIIQLGAIEKMCRINSETTFSMVKNLEEFSRESMERVRSAVKAMKPREFEEYEGVIAITEMIKNFEKLTGVSIAFRVSDNIWKLNSDQTMVIYRIIQEFLSNSIRHGKASRIDIFMNFLDTHLRIYLKDNGKGCSDIQAGVGLTGIKERVSVWGGTIDYYSEADKGFELTVTMEKVKLSLDGV